MSVGGKTKVLGLIGDPVEHTLSPVIHNTLSGLYSESESPAVYVPFRVSHEGLESAVKGAFELGIRGLNVTVPHKSAVIPFLEKTDPMAEAIGAVNTLVRGEKGFAGYNTDAEGFKRELLYYGIDMAGKKAVMLGGGGAGRAVAFALASMGAESIYIFNRGLQKAADIAAAVNAYFGRDIALADTYDNLSRVYSESYLAVQCTSVGLYPDIDRCVVEDGEFFEHAFAGVDVIYKPVETLFMKRLRERGKAAYNGLRMLMYQGIAAYERFMDRSLSLKECDRMSWRLKEAAGLGRCIVLTGYMGSGKSSVAKHLAGILGMEAAEADALIEDRKGMSINGIFASEGEEAFRKAETELIGELMKRDEAFILSTGGGMPMREENRKLLKDGLYGRIVYLRAGADTLCRRLSEDTSRPLLKGGNLPGRIVAMLAERGPVYEDFAEIVVDTDDMTPQEIAEYIAGRIKDGTD